MSDTLRLVSTTDTPEQMQAAMARATGEPVVETPVVETPPPADGTAVVPPPEGETPPPAADEPKVVDPAVSEAARVLAESKGKSKADERKASIQAEIDRLNWQKHHTASLVAAEERRLAELQAEAASRSSKPAEPAAVVAERPKIEDFADYDQFTEAVAEWKAEIKVAAVRAELKALTDGLKTREVEAQQTTEQQQLRVIEQAHEARVVAFAATKADYAEVMAAAQEEGRQMTPAMLAHLVNDDMGPETAYALATMPADEFRAIVALPERRMLATLGRLAGQILSTRPAAAPPTGPAAKAPLNLPPPPPKPVSGAGSASTKSPDQMTPAEYSAWRRKTRAS